ncbi:MAG: hypothetical protein B7Z51_10110 [Methyloversatilis sp. 12-65-5]|nr:MAG: hypothetical protein B7Z51_10110 [Methyloversatilis sp. 12-65-5]
MDVRRSHRICRTDFAGGLTVYFSLISPEPGQERNAAHEWLQGAYSEHQLLWRFFPSPHGTGRDFLFRRRDVDGVPRFYVVSQRKPEAPHPACRRRTVLRRGRGRVGL